MSLVTLLLALGVVLLGLVLVTSLTVNAAWVAVGLALVAIVVAVTNNDRRVG